MSDRLNEALTWIDDYVDAVRRGDPDQTLEPLEELFDAARRFANLTSPETIEKGAKALINATSPGGWTSAFHTERMEARRLVRNLLRAVTEEESPVAKPTSRDS